MSELLLFENPPFLPTRYKENISLWLDGADESVFTKVANRPSNWASKAGGADDAVQLTALNQGTWTENSIGGKPALVLTDDQFMTVANSSFLNFDSGAGSTILMVVDFDGYNNQGSSLNVLLGKGSAQLATDTYNLQTSSNNQIKFQSGNNEIIQNESGTFNGAAHVITAVMDNANANAMIYLDGIVDTNSSAIVGSDNASDLVIGGDSGVTRYSGGKYGEIIIYNRPLSSSELSLVWAYLNAKWGFP